MDVLSSMVQIGQMDKKEEEAAIKALETPEEKTIREIKEENEIN